MDGKKNLDSGEKSQDRLDLEAVNLELESTNQQLVAIQQQLRAANQQLAASNQQLRAAEEQLRTSRARYKAVFEGTINAVTVYEAMGGGNDFILRNLNPAAERIEKVKRKDVIDKTILNLFPNAAESGLIDVCRNVFKTAQPRHHCDNVYRGGRIEKSRDFYIFKLSMGQIIAIYLDVTERKQVEETLAEEHNLLRTLIDNLPDSIYVKDNDGRFVVANKEVARRTGLKTPQRLIGKTDKDIHPEELADKYHIDEQQVIKTGRPMYHREEQVVDKSTDEVIWNLTTKIPLRDNQDRIAGIIGIGRNITRLKQIEQQLNAANQQLIANEQQLRAANQQLEAANQQLSAANQQLMASEQQLRASNQQFEATNQQLKATEQALQASRERYKTLFEGTFEGIAMFDAVGQGDDFTFRHINPAAEKIDSIKWEDVKGKSILKALPGVKESGLLDVLKRVCRTGQPEHFLDAFYKDERISGWRDSYIYKLPTGQIIVVYEDTTERKLAQQALKHSEEIYRKAIENAQGVPYRLRCSDNKYDFVGSGIEKLIGISADKLTRERFNSLIEEITGVPGIDGKLAVSHHRVFIEDQGKSASPEKMAYRQAIAEGRIDSYHVDIRIRTPKGQVKWLSDNSLPVRDTETGEITAFIGILQDITARKQAEQKLLVYQGQLKSLASQLSLAEERERRRIATNLHDRIGQALVISKVKLEQLRKSVSNDENFANELDEISKSITQTIEDTRLLTFDLSYPILYELGFEAAVSEWLTDQVQQKHGIETEFADDGKSKPLEEDLRVLLFRDVRELLVNVVKHAKAKKVRVVVQKIDSEMQISVEDDGVGFKVGEVSSIASKTGGFGLFSIRERLEPLGGRLKIESVPGQGCCVIITAPLKQSGD